MTAITLSIVVPTYNRCCLLGFLLASICDDFPVWPGDLELIVMDNASTDATAEVLNQLAARPCPVKVIRHSRNLGMDGNLAAGFGAAAGKYLWQIGDDEILRRGAASYVLNVCRVQDFGLVHLSHTGFADGAQEAQRAMAVPSVIRLRRLDSADLYRSVNVFLTFISANVVNRRAVLDHFPDFDSRADSQTFLPQLAWTYAALKAGNRHCVVDTPLFSALSGNTGGYKLVEVFCINLKAITERRLNDMWSRAASIMANAVLLRLIPGELMSQARQTVLKSGFAKEDITAELHRIYGSNAYFVGLVRHVLNGPLWKRRSIHFLIRIFNRLNQSLGFRFL